MNGGPSHLSSAVSASGSAACAGGGMSETVKGFGTVHGESGLVQLGLWGKWKNNCVILVKPRRSCACTGVILYNVNSIEEEILHNFCTESQLCQCF